MRSTRTLAQTIAKAKSVPMLTSSPTKNDSKFEDRGEPSHANGIDAERDGVRDVELVVRDDAGQYEANEHIKEPANRQRT